MNVGHKNVEGGIKIRYGSVHERSQENLTTTLKI
jgi:hypothetical protein